MFICSTSKLVNNQITKYVQNNIFHENFKVKFLNIDPLNLCFLLF